MCIQSLNIKLVFLSLFVFSIVCIPVYSNAQFDRLIKATTDKLGDEVERMAIEKISDIIAREAAERIEKEFDELLMEAMKNDTAYQSPYDRDSAMRQLGASYGAFLQGLNESADLPDEYTFQINMLVEVTTEGEEPQHMRWYFSDNEPILGIQTAKSETESQFVVMDMGRDVMVMYQDNDGKKTAQAIPNVMKFAGSMANTDVEGQLDYEITEIKKRRKVAGYKCQGYEGISSDGDQRFEAYVTTELGIEWKDTFGEMMKNFATADVVNKSFEKMNGMTLASEQYDTKSGKMTSSYVAQEISEQENTITNADYSFGQQE